MKMKIISVYCNILAICFFSFFSFFSSVHAEEVDAKIKIDFARVQDVSGETPGKTAACIIFWVVDDVEDIFCWYQLEKNTSFFRDNNDVNKIFGNNGKLFKATLTSLPINIKTWLDNIEHEQGLGKKLPATLKSKISKLFNDFFVKQGVKDYSSLEYKTGLFKHSKPYDLILLKNLEAPQRIENESFALLAHYDIHRAVVKLISFNEDTRYKNGIYLDNKSQYEDSTKQKKSKQTNTTAYSNPYLQNIACNNGTNSAADGSKTNESSLLEQIITSISKTVTLKDIAMLLILSGIILLCLFVVVVWFSKKSDATKSDATKSDPTAKEKEVAV